MQTETIERQENPMAGIPAREGKYLTFSLAGEEYGIGILKVKEIIGMMNITPVPQTPEFVKGVINLRGKSSPSWTCACGSPSRPRPTRSAPASSSWRWRGRAAPS